MSGPLDSLRSRLRKDQRGLLDTIFSDFSTPDAKRWPLVIEIQVELGKTAVESVLGGLPPGLVYVEGEQYRMGLAGVLVTTGGAGLEGLLVRYLEHWKAIVKADPTQVSSRVKSAEIAAALQIDTEQVRLLGQTILVGGLFSDVHSLGGPVWMASAPREIAEISESGDLNAFVQRHAVEQAKRLADARPPLGATAIPTMLEAPVPPNASAQPSEAARIPWGPVRSVLGRLSFSVIKEVLGLAGLEPQTLSHLDQSQGASREQLLLEADRYLARSGAEPHRRFVTIVAEEALRRRAVQGDHLESSLSRLGWTFQRGSLVPIQLLDPGDLAELPDESRDDLVKAAGRYRDGDLSGALSSACAAVDSATGAIYGRYGLGDPGSATFQEKVAASIKAHGVLVQLDADLLALGWNDPDRKMFQENLRGSINQAAYVMQKLRSEMSDVHGTKGVLRPLVFDALKYAALIVRMLVSVPATE